MSTGCIFAGQNNQYKRHGKSYAKSETWAELLVGFLNLLLEPDVTIQDIRYLNTLSFATICTKKSRPAA